MGTPEFIASLLEVWVAWEPAKCGWYLKKRQSYGGLCP